MSGGADAAARAAAADKVEAFTVPAAAYTALQADEPQRGRAAHAAEARSNGLCVQMGDGGVFARIYGFSFEGHYYKLPRPVLFLVRGGDS